MSDDEMIPMEAHPERIPVPVPVDGEHHQFVTDAEVEFQQMLPGLTEPVELTPEQEEHARRYFGVDRPILDAPTLPAWMLEDPDA